MSNNKKYVVDADFIATSSRINLSLNEFFLLLYFENADDDTFDIEKISSKLKIEASYLLEAFNNLLSKGIIKIEVGMNEQNKRYDKISLEGFYQKVTDLKNKNDKNKIKEDIFTKFEKEFQRPLTGTEFEIIKAWLEKMYSEELILKALEEAIYNGATSIRYIDTILYEWNKKGFKTKEDVDNYLKNRFEKKKIEETNVFDYNWLEDYDK